MLEKELIPEKFTTRINIEFTRYGVLKYRISNIINEREQRKQLYLISIRMGFIKNIVT